MTKAQRSLKVRWRPALLFLSMVVLAAAALHDVAIFGGSGSSGSVFAQAPPAKPFNFNIVTFGDSIMWGQGLPESMKFRTLVANWLVTEWGSSRRVVQWPTHAHSGAIILGDQYNQLDGEIPDDNPSISLQVVLTLRDLQGRIDPADVDLVLVDGGVNNVGILEVLKPNHSPETIERFTNAAMDKMEDLLKKVMNAFPNATIVVTGYFPPISPSSDLQAVAALIGKFRGELVGAVAGFALDKAKDSMVKNSAAFAGTAYTRLVDMVKRLNPPPPAPARVGLAWPNIQSDNAYGAPNSFLWKVEDFVEPEANALKGVNPPPPFTLDRVAWDRVRACVAVGQGKNVKCLDASMGHPNVAGAQAYANAIIDQLRGPLAARTFPPPVVSAVSPNTTQCGASTPVTITGANFYSVWRVSLDGRQNLGFTVQSKSQITATLPDSIPAGTHAITVNPGSAGSASGALTVTPIITSINPAHGPVTGGTFVMVSGACLFDPVSPNPVPISFGSKFVVAQCSTGFTGCGVVSPPAASLGVVDVVAAVSGARSAITPVTHFSYDKEYPSPSYLTLPDARFGPQTAVVSLDGYAPPGGAVLALSSSDPSHVSVQPTVTVPAGTTTYTNVGLTFLPTSTSEDVTLTATYQGNSARAIAHLLPWPPLTLSADFVSGFAPPGRPAPTFITGKIFLNALAPTGGAVVSLTYTPPPPARSPGRLRPPANPPPASATVTIPAGSFWTTFTFPYSLPVGNPNIIYDVTISATYRGASASTSLEISPGGKGPPKGPPKPGGQTIQ